MGVVACWRCCGVGLLVGAMACGGGDDAPPESPQDSAEEAGSGAGDSEAETGEGSRGDRDAKDPSAELDTSDKDMAEAAMEDSQDAQGSQDSQDVDPSDEEPRGPEDFEVLQVDGPDPAFLEEVHDGWEVMLVADWEMEANEEGYWCARKTVEEDVYFSATVPMSPPGTHHTLLSIETEPTEPDGIARCSAGTNGDIMIAGSGVGTDELIFPEGVAMLVPKGRS